MRLKRYSLREKILIGKKIKKICRKNNVKFIVNDDPFIAKKLEADGCHLGQRDMIIGEAQNIIGNKIIGVTCHNSIKLAKNAIKSKAKKTKFRATTKILKEVKKLTNIPIVAIGGINSSNYKKLLLNNANFLAISSYIWHNKNYKPKEAIELLK